MEGEAPGFEFEKVGAAWPATHWVRSGQWSWSSRSPYLCGEKNQWLASWLKIARPPLQEPQVQQGPQVERVLE